jgi:hypothetical protein
VKIVCLNVPAIVLTFAAVMIMSSGCGPKVETVTTYSVSGQVTHNGKPVPKGNILFTPDNSRGNSGPGTSAEIVDGKYQTAEGKGVVGGAYTLTVQGYDGVPIESGEGGMDETGTALFPPKKVEADFPESDTTHDIEL